MFVQDLKYHASFVQTIVFFVDQSYQLAIYSKNQVDVFE